MVTTLDVLDKDSVARTVATTDALIALVGALTDSKEIDPDAASATQLSILRGILQVALTAAAETKVKTEGQVFHVFTTPTVTAGAYAANDVVGVEQTLANAARVSGGGGIISSVAMSSEGGTIAADDVEVLFFTSDPAGTYTDNGALAVPDADTFLLLGSVILDTLVDTGDGWLLKATNVNIPYTCTGGTSLFAVAVARGASFAPDATDGVGFVYGLLRD